MIGPHILPNHQRLTAADTCAAEFTLMPCCQTFPKQIRSHILLKKSRYNAPACLLDIPDKFTELILGWDSQRRKLQPLIRKAKENSNMKQSRA